MPVLLEISPGRLKVAGTGFFITRYGLVATAAHVFEGPSGAEGQRLPPAYVLQDTGSGELYIRRIVSASISRHADVAIAQADNGVGGSGPEGPMNMRATLALQRPAAGESLSTFAYPENAIMDFTGSHSPPELRGDYFTGTFLAEVETGSRPFIPLSHYETSVEIRSGASGSPIFDSRGRVIGIACRGWDFRGGDLEGDNLSSILPVRHLLPIDVACARIPRDSWEYRELPATRRDATLTFGDLVAYRHVDTST